MATIHFGRQLTPVGPGRLVAIKRIRGDLARSGQFRTMFLDEARLTSGLDHTNVVRTLDFVTTADELMIVMELVRGESLFKLLRACGERQVSAPLPIISAIVGGALDGLHAAHEARGPSGQPLQAVHRDVSPQNILIGTDGVAKIADFGIAKAVGRAHITQEGEVKGKLAFMPPEQLRGEAVDRRADVYAMAVVLWEAIAGRRLFAGDQASVVFQILEDQPVPPSTYRPDAPAGLDALVLRGLSQDRDARFSTALEMARALEQILPPARPREVGEWVRMLAAESIEAQDAVVREIELAGTASLPATQQLPATDPPKTVSAPASRDRQPPASKRVWTFGLVALCAAALLGVAAASLWLVGSDAEEPDRLIPLPSTGKDLKSSTQTADGKTTTAPSPPRPTNSPTAIAPSPTYPTVTTTKPGPSQPTRSDGRSPRMPEPPTVPLPNRGPAASDPFRTPE